jgi:hypothetical protein
MSSGIVYSVFCTMMSEMAAGEPPVVGEGCVFYGVFSYEAAAKNAISRYVKKDEIRGNAGVYRYTVFRSCLNELDTFEDYFDVWNFPMNSGRGGSRSFWTEYTVLPLASSES